MLESSINHTWIPSPFNEWNRKNWPPPAYTSTGWVWEIKTGWSSGKKPTSIEEYITSFISIAMFYGTDSIMWNIPYIHYEWWNISLNIVSPKEHCYGSKWCYAYRMYLGSIRNTQNMSTWNRLNLEPLGFQVIMPKNLAGHCRHVFLTLCHISHQPIDTLWVICNDITIIYIYIYAICY